MFKPINCIDSVIVYSDICIVCDAPKDNCAKCDGFLDLCMHTDD